MSESWTREEVEATVGDYFHILTMELAAQEYNKSEHRRRLMQRLKRCSEGAVERKHQNISAILIELGLPYISGYKPLGNYQSLLSDVIVDRLTREISGAGKTWIEEYGSADNEQDFRVLNAYSPYHRVRPRTKYPSVLLVSADSDDRVDPMHARKFAARLQAASTGGPVLLRIQRNAGHGGADSVSAAVEAAADEYAFALTQMTSGE